MKVKVNDKVMADIVEEQGAKGLCTMCALKKGVGA